MKETRWPVANVEKRSVRSIAQQLNVMEIRRRRKRKRVSLGRHLYDNVGDGLVLRLCRWHVSLDSNRSRKIVISIAHVVLVVR